MSESSNACARCGSVVYPHTCWPLESPANAAPPAQVSSPEPPEPPPTRGDSVEEREHVTDEGTTCWCDPEVLRVEGRVHRAETIATLTEKVKELEAERDRMAAALREVQTRRHRLNDAMGYPFVEEYVDTALAALDTEGGEG